MSEISASVPASGERRGQVHDLGYERYDGPRRPQSSRYLTIVRHVVTSSWRGWWRMKMWVISAALTCFAVGTIMYVSEGLSDLMRRGKKLPLADALLPMSFQFFELSAMMLTLTVLSGLIAADLRTGAFEFYFSRPLRARDYILGKLGGAALMTGAMLFVAPVALSLFRLGLMGPDELAGGLRLVGKTAIIGVLATAVYTAVPVAFSALSSRKRYTLAGWAGFYFIVGNIIRALGQEMDLGTIEVLHIPTAVNTVAYRIYDVQPIFAVGDQPPLGAALLAIAGYVILSVGIITWRVEAAERAGMGGS